MYERGRGVSQDDAEAVRWYRLAAEQGDATAQTNLGWMYDQGRGVPQDDAEAVRWYQRAAAQGSASGRAHLGVAMVRGVGIDADREEGWRLIGLAAKEENVSALLALAARHRLGLDTVPDHTAARALYLSAIEAGGAADGHLGLLALEPPGPSAVVREAMLRVVEAFPEGGGFTGGAALDAATRLLEAARAGSPERAAEALALLDRHDPLTTALDPVSWREAVASAPSSAVASSAGGTGAAASIRPFAVLVEAELLDERRRIAALVAAETFNDELEQRQERVAELVYLLGDTDGALAEKLIALRYAQTRATLEWGSADNYFPLLYTSCRWSKASRWARQLERPGTALFMAKQAVNLLQDARRRLAGLPENLRECFLKVHEDRYRWLADLFVELGRLGEAELVIRMLKDFETYEYVRREAGSAGSSYDHLPLDQREAALGTALGDAGRVQAALSLERRNLLKRQAMGEPDPGAALAGGGRADRPHRIRRGTQRAGRA
ncbi:tetratricopeptide repeat protein [Azospirillum brasilense]|uniref:tetratricopeptide repeat protein n=1 Tax=Azospirillum brasilense TaxID=192 RepID=UPI000687523D